MGLTRDQAEWIDADLDGHPVGDNICIDDELLAVIATGGITELLESGVEPREVMRRMIASGNWSPAGAADFLSFLTHEPDAPRD